MASKTGRILDAFLFCTISLTLPAAAQESTYSADSLMAAFEKGSKVSPKGSEVVFRDVVVESKNSKVIFKSSHRDKVICELVSIKNHDKPPSVGSELTVTGKVRGRGLLGNVTLDYCSVALVADSTVSTSPGPQEVGSGPSDTLPAEDVTPASLPEHSREHVREPAKKPATTRSIQPAKPSPGRVKQEAVLTSESGLASQGGIPSQGGLTSQAGRQDQTTRNSESRRDGRYRFYVLLVLGGALVYGILAKLLGSALRRLRYSKASNSNNTPEVRQAALELLLIKASKKKKA